MSALETALALAAQGFPVFPCGRNKRPSIPGGRGFHDATTDAEQIRSLFGRSGELVGCPTGAITGFDVLDFDYEHGAAQWEQENLYRLPQTRIHRTQSGGRHYLFRHAPGVRNTASKIAPGIDIRGEGGYVILPPSVGYEVINDADLAEWPDWLLELIFSKPPPPRTNGYHHQPISSARLDGFIRAVVGRVTAAGEGGKHFALRNAALSIGGIQVAAGLSDAQAKQMLIHALPQTVKDWRNADHTIEWGLAHGRERPLELEDREPRRNGHATPPPHEASPEPGPEPPPSADNDNNLPLVYFEDIKANLDTADFVENLLIKASMAVVYGESNCGKTFFMTDLALHVAMGKTWRGREIETGGVIYCALEGSNGISNRVAAFRKHHGLEDVRLPFAIVPYSLNMLDPNADLPRLIAAISDAKEMMGCAVVLVVIDTLSRALAGGNENAPDDMGALVINSDKVRQATGTALVYIHHSGKDTARGARGHSLLRAATDTEIEVARDDPQGPSVARVTKQRELEIEGEFPFRLDRVELGTNRRGKAVTSCVVVAHENVNGTKRDKIGGTKRLPDTAAIAVRALVAAMSKHGAKLPPVSQYPFNTTAVSSAAWKDAFYQLKSGTPDTKKHAFSRAEDVLLARNIITQMDGLVWFVRRDTETGQTGQNGTKRDTEDYC